MASFPTQPTPLTPVLSRYWDDPKSWTMATYRSNDGYGALQKALDMEPDQVLQTVKDSGLRGRGGAGFSTGTASRITWWSTPTNPSQGHARTCR
jgi:NADH-quinone oxidoreductase subunit F